MEDLIGVKWFLHEIRVNPPISGGDKTGDLPIITEKLLERNDSVVLVGRPGVGKTFYIKYVVQMLKQNRKFLHLVQLDAEKCAEIKSMEDVAKMQVEQNYLPKEQETRFAIAIQTEPHNVLFIVDNLDKYFDKHDEKNFVRQIVCGDLYAESTRLLSMRQAHPGMNRAVKYHIEILGFADHNAAEQFMKYALTTNHRINRTSPLLNFLSLHPIFREICLIPRVAEILVTIYAQDGKCIKGTETLLLHKVVVQWIKLAVPELAEIESLYKLPAQLKEQLLHISQIAYVSLPWGVDDVDRGFPLAVQEISRLNLQGGVSSLDDIKKFDLMACTGNTVHNFLHLIVHEFLAALYISSLAQDEQIAFYYEEFPKNIRHYQRVCLFHFGLTRLETEEFLNPSKIVLAGMAESLAHVTLKQEGGLYLELQQLILACLYEAQDSTLVKNFCQQSLKLMEIEFTDSRTLDDERFVGHLVYVIAHSDILSWDIEIRNIAYRNQADMLVFHISSTVSSRTIKVDIKIQPDQSPYLRLKPIVQAKAPKRTGRATEMIKRAQNEEEKEMYFQHAMMCTGQRETLHRVTQLFSPVPVKSDATDPAYSSLITCGCAEQKLKAEVVFEPIHPIHTVQLSSKSKKVKAPELERAATRKHIEENHESKYLEIIVLSKPSVKSITFQPPGGGQPCRLVLSADKLPTCMAGRIAMEVKNVVVDQSMFTECINEAHELSSATSMMVTHGLPLPKSKTKSEAEKANASQAEQTVDMKVKDNVPPATAAEVAPSHQAYKNIQEGDNDHFSMYGPVPVQAETTEKTTWRPGMIMFTVSTCIMCAVAEIFAPCCLFNFHVGVPNYTYV